MLTIILASYFLAHTSQPSAQYEFCRYYVIIFVGMVTVQPLAGMLRESAEACQTGMPACTLKYLCVYDTQRSGDFELTTFRFETSRILKKLQKYLQETKVD